MFYVFACFLLQILKTFFDYLFVVKFESTSRNLACSYLKKRGGPGMQLMELTRLIQLIFQNFENWLFEKVVLRKSAVLNHSPKWALRSFILFTTIINSAEFSKGKCFIGVL